MNMPPNPRRKPRPRPRRCLQHGAVAVHRQERGEPPELSEDKVLGWADAFYASNGDWPRWDSGPIPELSGETWLSVSAALALGLRGFRPGGSLPGFFARHGRVRSNASDRQLLRKHRGIRNTTDVPSLSIPQILAWADAHRARTGKWPNHLAGPIPEAPDETWRKVQAALVNGIRGLPGGSSLAQLLTARRGLRNPKRPPDLTISQILAWADAFHARTACRPKPTSGPIPEAPGETWCIVELALKAGARGLPGTSRLTRLLAERRGWRYPSRRPALTVPQVLAWVDASRARTGHWPKRESGPILEAPGETWMAVHRALQEGRRGLPGGSSLARLMRHRAFRAGTSENAALSVNLRLPAAHSRRSCVTMSPVTLDQRVSATRDFGSDRIRGREPDNPPLALQARADLARRGDCSPDPRDPGVDALGRAAGISPFS